MPDHESALHAAAPVREGSLRPWRAPARGGYPAPELFALSGLERLRALLSGRMPRPPIQRLTGLLLREVESGSAVFEMPLSPWLCSSRGAISIGVLSILADAALGCAVQSVLPPATALSTSELSLRLLAPAMPGGTAVARATVVHAGRTLALSETTVTDERGRLLAHGSSLCVIMPPDLAAAAPGELERTPVSSCASPDPWARVPAGRPIDQRAWDTMAGLEVLRAQLAGELPEPPIGHLTGLRLAAVAQDAAAFAMPATEWLCAPPAGRAQGGAVALIADAALTAAIQTKLAAATSLTPIDLKLNYLRPLATDGREAVARGSLLHAGRRIAVASAEVMDGGGKPVALATGSAMLLAGRRPSLENQSP